MRQTGVDWVAIDLTIARVAAFIPQNPNGCLGLTSPHLASEGPNLMQVSMDQKLNYVGIDVAKARVDVAVRPGDDIWSNDHEEAGIAGWRSGWRL